MILAYFLIKFSSLNMNSERELAAPKPGRLIFVALLATDRRTSGLLPRRSSIPPLSADRFAILKIHKQNKLYYITINCKYDRLAILKQIEENTYLICNNLLYIKKTAEKTYKNKRKHKRKHERLKGGRNNHWQLSPFHAIKWIQIQPFLYLNYICVLIKRLLDHPQALGFTHHGTC